MKAREEIPQASFPPLSGGRNRTPAPPLSGLRVHGRDGGVGRRPWLLSKKWDGDCPREDTAVCVMIRMKVPDGHRERRGTSGRLGSFLPMEHTSLGYRHHFFICPRPSLCSFSLALTPGSRILGLPGPHHAASIPPPFGG